MNVYAIVVLYNPDPHIVERQYKGLIHQVEGIIYIDNGSEDYSLCKKLRGLTTFFIRNEDNLGLAKAQNQGIELAREKNSDFVLFLDQDSLFPEDFVYNLVNSYLKASSFMKVALVGPAVKNMIYKNSNGLSGIVLCGFILKKINVRDLTPVSFCISSGSIVPMSVLEDVGLMEDKLFIDGIDIEWCLRARYKGYQIIQTNCTYLDHCLGDGRDKRVESHSPLREYYIMRNSTWMIRQKHIPIGYRIRKVFTALGRLCLSFKSLNIEYVKSDMRGFKDGLKF